MPRKPLHTHKLNGFYVKPEWAALLDKLAADSGRTRVEVIREALREYFERRKLPT